MVSLTWKLEIELIISLIVKIMKAILRMKIFYSERYIESSRANI